MTRFRFLHSLARAASWHRRKLAAIAAACAVLTAINAASPPPPASAPAVRATRPLAGGLVIGAADVEIVALPLEAIPEQVIDDPDLVIGKTLVAPLSPQSVLTELSVLSDRSVSRKGLVVAPLRIEDPELRALIRPGDRISVLAAEPQGGTASLIAEHIRVLTVPTAPSDGGGLGSPVEAPTELLLVEVEPATAALLAQSATMATISVILT